MTMQFDALPQLDAPTVSAFSPSTARLAGETYTGAGEPDGHLPIRHRITGAV
jgi:hypothetical protein